MEVAMKNTGVRPNEGMESRIRSAKIAVYIGRAFIALAFFALLGTWITQVSGGALLGMSQQHLFNDSIALSLLGIGFFIDSVPHFKGV